MVKKLTNKVGAKQKQENLNLTNRNQAKFKISIEQSLDKEYCFKKLNPSAAKKFHAFIEKIVGQDFSYVETAFKRHNDTNDYIYLNGSHGTKTQIVHYGDGTSIRLHGYISKGYFVLTRIDANHRFHN